MARTLDLAKQTAILKAARSIFIQDGYALAKMSDIAQEAGVAQGTLYLYYESKEELAGAIGEELFSRISKQCGAVIQKIEDPDDIVPLVDWALKVSAQESAILAMVKERSRGIKPKKEGRMRLVTEIAEALSTLKSRGVIRQYGDVTVLAELILSLLRRALMSRAIFEDTETTKLKNGMVEVLQHALFDDVTLTASRMLKRKKEAAPRASK
jgi:AcrR family transcriptional regulator